MNHDFRCRNLLLGRDHGRKCLPKMDALVSSCFIVFVSCGSFLSPTLLNAFASFVPQPTSLLVAALYYNDHNLSNLGILLINCMPNFGLEHSKMHIYESIIQNNFWGGAQSLLRPAPDREGVIPFNCLRTCNSSYIPDLCAR